MWKDIINYEGIYQINEYGDIISVGTGRILSPYINNKGYKMIDLQKNGVRERFLVHRLVAIHFVPNPENLPIVLHKDNNRLNIYYTNLKWGTYSENNSQAIRDGLNTVPKPDNRKYYEIYNSDEKIICYGVNEIIDNIGFGNDTNVRNIIFRNSIIKQGPYSGYKIKKKQIIKPIYF